MTLSDAFVLTEQEKDAIPSACFQFLEERRGSPLVVTKTRVSPSMFDGNVEVQRPSTVPTSRVADLADQDAASVSMRKQSPTSLPPAPTRKPPTLATTTIQFSGGPAAPDPRQRRKGMLEVEKPKTGRTRKTMPALKVEEAVDAALGEMLRGGVYRDSEVDMLSKSMQRSQSPDHARFRQENRFPGDDVPADWDEENGESLSRYFEKKRHGEQRTCKRSSRGAKELQVPSEDEWQHARRCRQAKKRKRLHLAPNSFRCC